MAREAEGVVASDGAKVTVPAAARESDGPQHLGDQHVLQHLGAQPPVADFGAPSNAAAFAATSPLLQKQKLGLERKE